MLTTIGLSAKYDVILIVEFAVEMMQKEGKTPIEAIIEAARYAFSRRTDDLWLYSRRAAAGYQNDGAGSARKTW
ncbi:hypothetical protein ACLBR5_04255 [Escherichia coli]